MSTKAELSRADTLVTTTSGWEAHETVPIWLSGTTFPQTARIEADTRVDVCVVGGGMAGLSVAYELLRGGRSVIVLERHTPGSGETQRSTAQLSTALEKRYFDLERLHGPEGARMAAESHAAAITHVERIVAEENIDCAFQRRDGYLFAAPGHGHDTLTRELRAARRAGLRGIDIVPRGPTPELDLGPCLRFAGQAEMSPTRYVAGLARAILCAGGRIFSETQAQTIEGGRPASVRTAHGPVIVAEHVVVATNTPVNNILALHTKQGAYRTYVIAAALRKGSVARALYWDTDAPYHYVRCTTDDDGNEWLLVGGEDHKTGQAHHPEQRWSRVEAWMRERFPMAGAVGSRWSGQVMESMDGLAFIGRNPLDDPHVLVVTGDSGVGITHGAIAGVLVADLICGRENRWARLYDPTRVSLAAAAEFVHENLTAVRPYADWVESGDVKGEHEIGRGQGAVVRHGLRLVAVYCDERGALHRCSAACPHLGGVVRWNEAEGSWDCPCHGSRFDAYGKVMHGPANIDLHPIEDTPLELGEIAAPPASSDVLLTAR